MVDSKSTNGRPSIQKKAGARSKLVPGQPSSPGADLLRGRDYLRMLRKSYVRLRTVVSDLITPFGLTTQQFLTLLSVSDSAGLTQAALCLELDSDANTVSQMLRRLETKNYLIRRKHPSDGRAVRVFITPTGKALVRKIQPEVDRLSLTLHSMLPAQGAESIADWLKALSDIRNLP